MRPEEFIESIYFAVYQTAVDSVKGLLSSPPGRRPRADLVALSAWYNALGERDRDRVADIARMAADHAVFGMLAVLDGERSLGPNVGFTLSSGGVDLAADHDLHELFQLRVDQEAGGATE